MGIVTSSKYFLNLKTIKSNICLGSGSQTIVCATLFFIIFQLSLVSCVPEDYYNPDYDEENSVTMPDPLLNTGNWGDFIQDDVDEPIVTRAGDDTDDDDIGEVIKRHLGSLAAKSSRLTSMGLRSHRNDIGIGADDDNNELYFGRATRLAYPFWKHSRMMGNNNAGVKKNIHGNSLFDSSSNSGRLKDSMNSFKNKRFLGSMARGGWFPRQFRGYVDSSNPQGGGGGGGGGQQWDKRHIGAAAKIGWLKPYKLHQMNNHKRDMSELFQNGRFTS